MSDNENDLDGVLDDRLREELKRARKDRRELESLRAEKVRIDLGAICDQEGIPADGQGLMFRESYNGPPTAEAVRAMGEKYGLLTPKPPEVDPALAAELLRLHQIQQATTGTGGASLTDHVAELQAKIAKAKDNAEVVALMTEYEASQQN